MKKKVVGYVDSMGKHYSTKSLDRIILGGASSGDVIHPRYSLEFLRELYAGNTYHAACVKTIATDVIGSGYSLDELIGGGDKKLVDNLFIRLNFVEEMEKALIDMKVFGYGVVEVVRAGNISGGKVVNVKHLRADSIKLMRDKKRYVQELFDDQVGGAGTSRRIYFKAFGEDFDMNATTGNIMTDSDNFEDKATEIYVFKKYSVLDAYYGETDVIQAVQSLLADQARRNYMLKFLQNYAVPSYAIVLTGDFEDTFDEEGNSEIDKNVASYVESLSEDPYSTMFLKFNGADVKVSLEKLGESGTDADFREFALDVRDEIISAHRVPPNRLGIENTGALGGNVSEEATKVYVSSVVTPIQNMINRFANECVLASWGLDSVWEFKLNELQSEMKLEELTFLLEAVTAQVLTADEMRSLISYKYNLK